MLFPAPWKGSFKSTGSVPGFLLKRINPTVMDSMREEKILKCTDCHKHIDPGLSSKIITA